jgi:Legionella pneumophila major outer membrane protein precursor
VPSTVTAVKYPVLESRFQGIGPAFGVDGRRTINPHLGLLGQISGVLLVGETNAMLNQKEVSGTGIVQFSNLHSGNQRFVVPTGHLKLGVTLTKLFENGDQLQIVSGYQATYYYRAINLLYPTFRTGLEQTNSDLYVQGPFVTVTVNG